jgi:hypothetical protein
MMPAAIPEHAMWIAPLAPLPPVDPAFKVVPERNTEDGMARYRRYLDSHFPQ